MATKTALWLRREASSHEQRTILTPSDAAALIADGFEVTVEESDHRTFSTADYSDARCRIVPADSFFDAPANTVVLGLKEPAKPERSLTHRHVYFGHVYFGQAAANDVLQRFASGGGSLLDLETLVDERGRRLTAFGYWAGYMGAVIAILFHRGQLKTPLRAKMLTEIESLLAASPGTNEKALVTGALGRAGRGAIDALTAAGAPVTSWDIPEAQDMERSQLLRHDILVNCISVTTPGEPFVTTDDLYEPHRRLLTVSDVTCDVTSDRNRLPVNDRSTTWDDPVRQFPGTPNPLAVLAIDNLPSLLPRESSAAFSADLAPLLRNIATGDSPVWLRSRKWFDDAITQFNTEG